MVSGFHGVRLKEEYSILLLIGLMFVVGFFIYHKYVDFRTFQAAKGHEL